jgi:uncharacterized RDD family membrane protein YckC
LISPLADPARRLAAYFLDSVALSVPLMLVVYGAMQRQNAGAIALCALGAAGCIAVLMLNAIWVHRRGQSIGKRAFRLRVVAGDGSRMSFWRILLLRNVLPMAIGVVPLLGPLYTGLDALFIFGAQRRTLHDRIADSLVVTVAPRSRPGA